MPLEKMIARTKTLEKILLERKNAFMRNEQGATSIEYGIIAVTVSIAIVVTLSTVGGQVLAMFQFALGELRSM